MQITKGSATFMGRVDSCFSWQVNGTADGEVRTQLLCGGGKPAADQFCRYEHSTNWCLQTVESTFSRFTTKQSNAQAAFFVRTATWDKH